MKRSATRTFVISLTFLCGVAAVLIYTGYNGLESENSYFVKEPISADELNSSNFSLIAFCDIVKNPEKYDGKIVRLKGKLSFGIEGAWFSEAKCGIDNAAVIESENDKVWAEIEKARTQKDKEFLINEIDLITIGRFKNTAYNEGGLKTPFRFEMFWIEKNGRKID